MESRNRSHTTPAKLHEDPKAKAAFACGWCPAKAICHEGQFARRNCRTCISATPVLDGTNGTMRIVDSDPGGMGIDSDTVRAMGPMQFIPETWREYGVDANNDGNADDSPTVIREVGATGYSTCQQLYTRLNAGDLFLSSPAFDAMKTRTSVP